MTDLCARFRFVPPVGPKTLPTGTAIEGFTPDPSMSWVVVYAIGCSDPECEEDHKRLLIMPIIGWAQIYLSEHERGMMLRPLIMLGDGRVTDYLDAPPEAQFISVMRSDKDVPTVAREIYAEIYGDRDTITEAE